MKGLECTEVEARHVFAQTETKRFDPEYFQRQHLVDERTVASAGSRFKTFADFGLRIDASAFYPAIEDYYGSGNLPFLRVADVDTVIDFEECTRIPAELCQRFPTLSRVQPGDIVFTKGGSVARVGLVTEQAAVSRDLISLNSSMPAEQDRLFLFVYFQTSFFNRVLLRSSSQTSRPHLTITPVRNLPLFEGTAELKTRCAALVKESYRHRATALEERNRAETVLFRRLGLENWEPPRELTYVRRLSEVLAWKRMDAEFFSPSYEALLDVLRREGAVRLGDVLREPVRRGISPVYCEDGDVPVINSQHVGKTELILKDNRTTRLEVIHSKLSVGRTGLVRHGDVLLNSTGRITIGRCQSVLDEITAVADNHISIIRLQAELDAVFLACFLNTMPGLMQTERSYTGSSGQIELRPELVEDYLIWAPAEQVQLAIRTHMERAHAARVKSRLLLDRAREAVELAIEATDAAAVQLLAAVESGYAQYVHRKP